MQRRQLCLLHRWMIHAGSLCGHPVTASPAGGGYLMSAAPSLLRSHLATSTRTSLLSLPTATEKNQMVDSHINLYGVNNQGPHKGVCFYSGYTPVCGSNYKDFDVAFFFLCLVPILSCLQVCRFNVVILPPNPIQNTYSTFTLNDDKPVHSHCWKCTLRKCNSALCLCVCFHSWSCDNLSAAPLPQCCWTSSLSPSFWCHVYEQGMPTNEYGVKIAAEIEIQPTNKVDIFHLTLSIKLWQVAN